MASNRHLAPGSSRELIGTARFPIARVRGLKTSDDSRAGPIYGGSPNSTYHPAAQVRPRDGLTPHREELPSLFSQSKPLSRGKRKDS